MGTEFRATEFEISIDGLFQTNLIEESEKEREGEPEEGKDGVNEHFSTTCKLNA